mmetsp:Transcript_9744/g.11139  ORF Transcript_9744/g.11139 Transcript_9744/m.11139 type:complete len:287 (+) Transcript_9744:2-862(+)
MPDIITMQEMDHLKQFVNDPEFSSLYTCHVKTTIKTGWKLKDSDPLTPLRFKEKWTLEDAEPLSPLTFHKGKKKSENDKNNSSSSSSNKKSDDGEDNEDAIDVDNANEKSKESSSIVGGYYQPAQYYCNKTNDGTENQDDDLCVKSYLDHLIQSKVSFAPKSYSNAANFRRRDEAKVKKQKMKVEAAGTATSKNEDYNNNNDDDEEEKPKDDDNKNAADTEKKEDDADIIDDDGVVIFWKRDKFRPIELGFLKYPSCKKKGKSEAVVAVVLEETNTTDKKKNSEKN